MQKNDLYYTCYSLFREKRKKKKKILNSIQTCAFQSSVTSVLCCRNLQSAIWLGFNVSTEQNMGEFPDDKVIATWTSPGKLFYIEFPLLNFATTTASTWSGWQASTEKKNTE